MTAVNYNALLISLVIGIVIPFLVDIITKKLAGGPIKTLVLLLLSLITGALTELFTVLNNGGTWSDWDWQSALFLIIITFVSAVTSFFGALKPAGLAGANGAVQNAIPGGVGKVVAPPLNPGEAPADGPVDPAV